MVGEYFCQRCVCEFPGCSKQKLYYRPWCLSHAWKDLPEELILVKALGEAGVLQLITPCDVAVLLEPRVTGIIKTHWLIELIAGWIKEPTAVRAWANVWICKSTATVTGSTVEDALCRTPFSQLPKQGKLQAPKQSQAKNIRNISPTLRSGVRICRASMSQQKVATCIEEGPAGSCA